MIVDKAITGTAVLPITGAGESGTAWLHEDNTGAEGQADVRIYHKFSDFLKTLDNFV